LLAGVLGCLWPATLPAQTLTFTGATTSVNFGSANVCRPGENGPAGIVNLTGQGAASSG
jgi:hypothetical protein